jgi:hypothetical protein
MRVRQLTTGEPATVIDNLEVLDKAGLIEIVRSINHKDEWRFVRFDIGPCVAVTESYWRLDFAVIEGAEADASP